MKEVAIKKVFGASNSTLAKELSILFLTWVVIAFVLATPIAVLGMQKWLSNYAYRTGISVAVVVGTFLASAFIALLAVMGNVIKASFANPIQTIKSLE